MKTALFAFLALAGLGWITEAVAVECPGKSAGGVCPIFQQGDPSCEVAAQLCGIELISDELQPSLVFAPPGITSTKDSVTVSPVSGTNSLAVDDNLSVKQQLDRPGMDIIIARRNSAYVYCGINLLHEFVTAPGTQSPNQVTVCFAKSSCSLPETGLAGSVESVCSAYNSASRTADFIQAYQLPDEQNKQNVSLCGCPSTNTDHNFAARFCDSRTSTFVNNQPSFVSCTPRATAASSVPILRNVESQGIATEGNATCSYITIGGRRLLVDSKTGSLC